MVEQTEHPGRTKVIAAIHSMRQAIERCVDDELWLPCLVLLYAAIDSMAWLTRKSEQADVTSEDFISWCDSYFPSSLRPDCSSIDLYGARCGILHSHTAESRLMRQGKARPLYYDLPDGEMLVPLRVSSAMQATVVRLSPFAGAVLRGFTTFIDAVDADTKLAQVVWERANTYYDHTVPSGRVALD